MDCDFTLVFLTIKETILFHMCLIQYAAYGYTGVKRCSFYDPARYERADDHINSAEIFSSPEPKAHM